MRAALILSLTMVPAVASANPDTDTAKAFIKSVKHGDDLVARYPGVVSEREAASLARVQKCDAVNLMKQPSGDYTVVWQCGGAALGMRLTVGGGKLAHVETFEVVARPTVGS